MVRQSLDRDRRQSPRRRGDRRRLLRCLRVFPALCLAVLAGPAASQNPPSYTFAQLADTQFGFFTEDREFTQETANYEFVVANLNRLKPAFVIICGDLINKPGDAAQRAEYLRITALLDPSIPFYAVSGNHDVGNEPSPASLADYREHFGPDWYSFRERDIYGIVLNSSVIAAPAAVESEAAAQEAWLREELARAKASGARHILVFQHHPWFLETADEADAYFNIPLATRSRYLAMFREAGVSHVFAGHYHRNAFGRDGELEMVTTGPVGRPLGEDESGFRLVHVRADGIEHEYIPLGRIPTRLDVAPAP
jgi:3',5'-cyclic AMP phosphodiesterase CpdA